MVELTAQLLKKDQITSIEIPSLKSLTIEKLYNEYCRGKEFECYFPDLAEKKLPERDFVYDVLSTVMHDEMKTIVRNALIERSERFKSFH